MLRVLCDRKYMEKVLFYGRYLERVLCDWEVCRESVLCDDRYV